MEEKSRDVVVNVNVTKAEEKPVESTMRKVAEKVVIGAGAVVAIAVAVLLGHDKGYQDACRDIFGDDDYPHVVTDEEGIPIISIE